MQEDHHHHHHHHHHHDSSSSSSHPPIGQRQRRRRRHRYQNHPAVNVIVASDAGKPIFARFGTPTEIARTCGLLQALRCSILYDVHLGSSSSSSSNGSSNNNRNNNNNNPLGDLHSIQSGSSLLVFMHVESIWLVAIAKTTSTSSTTCPTTTTAMPITTTTITQAYLRLLLEYVYSQFIFHLTNQVQAMFQHNASFDLQSMLGTSSSSSSSSIHGLMHSLLNQADVFISTMTSDNDNHDNDKQEEEEDHEVVVAAAGNGCEEPNDNDDDDDDDDSNGDGGNESRPSRGMAIINHINNNPAPFLSSCTPTLFPLSNHVREKTSEILQTIGQETPNSVFSILFTTTTTTLANNINSNNYCSHKKQQQQQHSSPASGGGCCKLLTCVQPSFRRHQLRTTDLNLFMHFCSQQLENNNNHNNNQGGAAAAASAELWLPVCLPRFHASGFLYCYTTRLDLGSSWTATSDDIDKNNKKPKNDCINRNNYLTLALLSQMGSTEQFQFFRTAATRIRRELGLPMPKESPVLTILSSSSLSPPTTPTLCVASPPNVNTTDQSSTVKTAMVQQKSNNHNDNDDVAWRRSFDNDDEGDNPTRDDDRDGDKDCHDLNDEDYVDASGDGNGIIPYVGIITGSLVPTFCAEVQRAMDSVYVQDFVTKEYLRDLIIATSSSSSKSHCNKHNKMFVRHFLFRFNAPIRIMSSSMNEVNNNNSNSRQLLVWKNHLHRRNSSASSTNSTNSSTTTTGHLTQCISSWLGNTDNHDDDDDFIHLQNKIWSRYQKINLRLRLGSASFESVLGAWDMITNDTTAPADTTAGDTSSSKKGNNNDNNKSSSPGIGCHCPAMGLLDSPPNFINGLTYIVDGKEMYLGMNGQDFELYVVLSSSSSSTICNSSSTSTSGDKHHHHTEKGKRARSIHVQQGAALAARLARRLLLDQDKLFIAKPFTWKQS